MDSKCHFHTIIESVTCVVQKTQSALEKGTKFEKCWKSSETKFSATKTPKKIQKISILAFGSLAGFWKITPGKKY